MLKIRNKLESIEFIKQANLNKFPEELFKQGEEEKVKKFLERYPAKYYAIRDKSKNAGIFKLAVLKENVLYEIKPYTLYTINVSSINYSSNQLLVGEIFIGNDNEVWGILSTQCDASVRDAIKNPTFNFKTTIYDKELLDKIKYFDIVYEYIINNNLKNYIIEFSLFNTTIGIKNENIIIYEVRTDY